MNNILFNLLRKNYIHVTSIQAYKKIIQDKAIKPNLGMYKTSSPQSNNSKCFKIGGVSLFDFSISDEMLFRNTFVNNFAEFFTLYKPITIILCLKKNLLKKRIIPYEKLKNVSHGFSVIPNVEICHKGKILLESIESHILVCGYSDLIFLKLNSKSLSDSELITSENAIKSKYIEKNAKKIYHSLNDPEEIFRRKHYKKIITWIENK